MNKKIVTILLTVLFLGGFTIFYQSRPVGQKAQTDIQTVQGTTNMQKLETKTDDQASVTVVVTPLDVSPQSATWKFDIGISTHSVELDQDMTKIVVLVDDKGKEYAPIKWEGPTGSHHREGVLSFNPITPAPKSIELKISGVGSVLRSFSWDLK